MMIAVSDREENSVGKEENAGFFFKVVQSRNCVVKS